LFNTRVIFQPAARHSALTDINQLVETGEITLIKGIGKSIAEVITELVKTGKSSNLEELKASTPPGMIEMLKIPGMGPKKVKAVWKNWAFPQ
jgi:DNA polymerase (family 10)